MASKKGFLSNDLLGRIDSVLTEGAHDDGYDDNWSEDGLSHLEEGEIDDGLPYGAGPENDGWRYATDVEKPRVRPRGQDAMYNRPQMPIEPVDALPKPQTGDISKDILTKTGLGPDVSGQYLKLRKEGNSIAVAAKAVGITPMRAQDIEHALNDMQYDMSIQEMRHTQALAPVGAEEVDNVMRRFMKCNPSDVGSMMDAVDCLADLAEMAFNDGNQSAHSLLRVMHQSFCKAVVGAPSQGRKAKRSRRPRKQEAPAKRAQPSRQEPLEQPSDLASLLRTMQADEQPKSYPIFESYEGDTPPHIELYESLVEKCGDLVNVTYHRPEAAFDSPNYVFMRDGIKIMEAEIIIRGGGAVGISLNREVSRDYKQVALASSSEVPGVANEIIAVLGEEIQLQGKLSKARANEMSAMDAAYERMMGLPAGEPPAPIHQPRQRQRPQPQQPHQRPAQPQHQPEEVLLAQSLLANQDYQYEPPPQVSEVLGGGGPRGFENVNTGYNSTATAVDFMSGSDMFSLDALDAIEDEYAHLHEEFGAPVTDFDYDDAPIDEGLLDD